jgi:hypothetical protein
MTHAAAFLYESFPAAGFDGHIAGVVLLEHPASQSWMQGPVAEHASDRCTAIDRGAAVAVQNHGERSAGKRLQMRVLEAASRRLAASGSWAGRITKSG